MKTRLIKTLQIGLIISGVIFLSVFTGCSQDNKNPNHTSMNMEKVQTDSIIVRTGIINLKMIDENKDGMVYQDPMDWNVISDKPGKCPLCKMTLVEVTVKEAEDNLVKNGYKVN